AWAVAMVSPDEIDKINILRASILAMHRALDALQIRPQSIIVDGNKFSPYNDIPYRTIVKGDGKYANIAAASVLAKTHRDEYMTQLAQQFPGYSWEINKGYPTAAHRKGIRDLGPTIHHRASFRLLPPEQLTLF
ncbi:MAG: ribonuclease HII, partial [Muribaculum sp.]|nr:ribonuclease HII [Muribaculum sp.]